MGFTKKLYIYTIKTTYGGAHGHQETNLQCLSCFRENKQKLKLGFVLANQQLRPKPYNEINTSK